MPLANDPFMLGKSMLSFRHLECQNLSIISEDIGRARMVQQFRRRRNGTEWRSTVALDDRIFFNHKEFEKIIADHTFDKNLLIILDLINNNEMVQKSKKQQ